MEGIEALQDRVNALLKRYSSTMHERDSLKKELGILRAENEELRTQLRQAEDGLLALQIGQAMPDSASREQSRKKLDAVIGEIDKILTTLND